MVRKQGKDKSGWASVLGQLRNPLTFFGLSLLVTESAFAGMLWRHSYTDKTVTILAFLMAGLLALSVLSVVFLTYKVPKNIIIQEARAASDELKDQKKKVELEEAREHFRRAREAVALVLDYAENGHKDVTSLFNVLSQVETLLTAPIEQPKPPLLEQPK